MYNLGYLLEKVARETTKSTREALYRNGSYILTYNLSLPYIGLSKYGDF